MRSNDHRLNVRELAAPRRPDTGAETPEIRNDHAAQVAQAIATLHAAAGHVRDGIRRLDSAEPSSPSELIVAIVATEAAIAALLQQVVCAT